MSKVRAHSYLETVEPYLPGDFAVEGVSEIVKLSSNESLLGASPTVEVALRGMKGALQTYPDSFCTEVRHAIGDRYDLDPERIVCEAGSEPLINLLARAYAGPGDEILYSQYGFIAYKLATEAVGATAVSATESEYTTDVDALLACQTKRTRIVFLANPNNPTGTRVTLTEVTRLRQGLAENVLLVLDAAYAEFDEDFSNDGSGLVDDEPGNVVVLHTFSKIYALAALRLGWAYAPLGVANILNQLRGVFTVSTPAQIAGAAALADREHTASVVEHTSRWRSWLSESLSELGLTVFPSSANFICVQFATNSEAEAADLALRQHGLIPRTLKEYGLPDCLRITIGFDQHCRAVVDVLSAVGLKKDGR
jgi:histidinol-phosphate aminotransferase